MRPPTKIELTEERLLAGMRKGIGFKLAQAIVLGVPWPLRSGWKERLIGSIIDEDQYDAFLAASPKMSRRASFEVSGLDPEKAPRGRRRKRRKNQEYRK